MVTHRIINGDSRIELKTLADCSVDSIVTDPPYELGFMAKTWDRSGIAYNVELWRECLRVLKPGGHLLAFGGSRTYHRMACAIEDAGFEIRDQLQWIYGCLSDDTEILVDGQWEPYHKATKDRLALCYNLEDETFEWQSIQELFVYQYSDTAFRIESDSTDQIVSKNHRCLVEQNGALAFRIAEEVAREREACVPVLEGLPELLNALPLPDEGASRSEQDVWPGMCSGVHQQASPAFAQASPTMSVVQESVSAVQRDRVSGREDLRLFVSGSVEAIAPGVASAFEGNSQQGSRWMDEGIPSVLQEKDERRKQPGVEGRRYLLSETRQLQTDQVCAVSAGIPANGPQGWLRDGASVVSGPSNRAVFDSTGNGTSRRSRSDQQCHVQLSAICHEPRSQTVRASRFTRSDLARIAPFQYDGVVWCVRVPSGAFVARRNGKVFITGNSGFPKSLDVSKAIDAAAGAEREIVGQQNWTNSKMDAGNGISGLRQAGGYAGEYEGSRIQCTITAPATDAAKQWQGYGTALKPAHEPIVLARRPIVGTVAANVLAHGTGGLNIDGCRIESEPITTSRNVALGSSSGGIYGAADTPAQFESHPNGRWPANIILDGSEEVLAGFPDSESTGGDGYKTSMFCGGQKTGGHGLGDSGSAARYFYCAKASKEDREEGLEALPTRSAGDVTDRKDGSDGLNSPRAGAGRTNGSRNHHPTVKPVDLMRYLCRLVTPPNGIVLDPFCGSGSTGKAAMLEDLNFIGIELSAEYCELAEKRIAAATSQGSLFSLEAIA